MSDGIQPSRLVKALHHFKGSNNDELWFNKGDVVTVTQSLDGGWWEGTLDAKTGWFPSNFVKEIKQDARSGARSPTPGMKPGELAISKRDSIRTYHDVVLRSLKDTERTFVNDIHLLLQTYLRPLQGESILSKVEFCNLCGNLEELAAFHHSLLAQLDECAKQPIIEQHVGGIFMKLATQAQAIYRAYYANHPHAVAVLQSHRDELNTFMENKGAPSPGIETLTTSISKPFSRLDKYSSMLKELERHTEESHSDRGDTQRAISIYRDIALSCADTRRQKEVEFEIMNAEIQGWEGEEMSQLGEVLILSHVRVLVENGEKKERLFLLFHHVLVMLSVTPKMSQYIYEGKLPVSGMNVNALEETDNYAYAFEITVKNIKDDSSTEESSMIDRRIVSCGGSADKKQWIDKLRQQAKLGPGHIPTKPENLQISGSQPSVTTVSAAKPAQIAQVIHPTPPPKPAVPTRNTDSILMSAPWTLTCLLPSPPLRPILIGREEAARSPRTGRRLLGTGKRKPAERTCAEEDLLHLNKRNDPKTLEEDAIILKVIEAYCTSAKARHTVNSLDLTKIRLTPNEMRDGRLGTANYHNLHCDLVLSAIDLGLFNDLDLGNGVEGQGHLVDSDSDSDEYGFDGIGRKPSASSSSLIRQHLARKLCCGGYPPPQSIARGFSKL